jgi:hypothetical protein
MCEVTTIAQSRGLTGVAVQVRAGWNWGARLLNRQTDLISSSGILAITTCLLASKIFEGLPPLLPRLSRIVFNFGGIIWLNPQAKDFLKTGTDLTRALHLKQWTAFLETTLKVVNQAFGILLTCVTFGCSFISAFGFPQISLAIQFALRPAALASLAATIFSDVRDYFINEALLKQFHQIENAPDAAMRIPQVVIALLEAMQRHPTSSGSHQLFADRVVRQLHRLTIETFQEKLAAKEAVEDLRVEALKLFFLLKDSIASKQASTEANLSLMVMGYIGMGICRAFPESLLEIFTRWSMSVLYTDELIRQKLFEADLAQALA